MTEFGYTQNLEIYDPTKHQTNPPQQHPFHTTQQVSLLRCCTSSHRLVHSTLRFHWPRFGPLTSSTGFCSINFNWSLPHQLLQTTRLQLVFADSTSTAALHNFNCIKLALAENPSEMFQTPKLNCTIII